MPDTVAPAVAEAANEAADDLLASLANHDPDAELPAAENAADEPEPEAETPEPEAAEPEPTEETTTASEPVVPEPAAAAVTPSAAAPATPAAPVAEPDPVHARQAEVLREIGTFKAKLAADTFDPLDDGPKLAKLQIERQEYLDAQLEVETVWTQQAKEHGLPRATLETIWTNAQKAVKADFPDLDGEALKGAAIVTYRQQVKAAKAAPATPAPTSTNNPAKPKPPAAPVTKGAARVTTPGSSTTPPKPRAKTPEEEFDQRFSGHLGKLLD